MGRGTDLANGRKDRHVVVFARIDGRRDLLGEVRVGGELDVLADLALVVHQAHVAVVEADQLVLL